MQNEASWGWGVYQTQRALWTGLGVWGFILSAMRGQRGIWVGSREDHICVLEDYYNCRVEPRLRKRDQLGSHARNSVCSFSALCLTSFPSSGIFSFLPKSIETLPFLQTTWRAQLFQPFLTPLSPKVLFGSWGHILLAASRGVTSSCTEPGQSCGAEPNACHLCFSILVSCIASWRIYQPW